MAKPLIFLTGVTGKIGGALLKDLLTDAAAGQLSLRIGTRSPEKIGIIGTKSGAGTPNP